MNKIERKPFTNYSGGNSLFGSICASSFYVKDVKDKFPSYEVCQGNRHW